MLFSNDRRVNEDLERIRKANLSPEQLAAEEQAEARDKKVITENLEKLSVKDFLALVIAAFSVVLPYAAIFTGLLALFWIVIHFLSR